MTKNRMEAFSDGVLAIIITIMVLKLEAPHRIDFQSLIECFPAFITYVLSFVYVGIYWANHHHLIHAVNRLTKTSLGQSSLDLLDVSDSFWHRMDRLSP